VERERDRDGGEAAAVEDSGAGVGGADVDVAGGQESTGDERAENDHARGALRTARGRRVTVTARMAECDDETLPFTYFYTQTGSEVESPSDSNESSDDGDSPGQDIARASRTLQRRLPRARRVLDQE
jgi:hypothetical protein